MYLSILVKSKSVGGLTHLEASYCSELILQGSWIAMKLKRLITIEIWKFKWLLRAVCMGYILLNPPEGVPWTINRPLSLFDTRKRSFLRTKSPFLNNQSCNLISKLSKKHIRYQITEVRETGHIWRPCTQAWMSNDLKIDFIGIILVTLRALYVISLL